MSESLVLQVREADFFQHKSTEDPIPPDAIFLIRYMSIAEGLLPLDQSLYLRPGPTANEVWQRSVSAWPGAEDDVATGRIFVFQAADWSPRLEKALAEVLIEAPWPFVIFMEVVAEGLIRADTLTAARDRFEENRRQNDARAREQEKAAPSPIIETARELGLNPMPVGAAPPHCWTARCPGTNHTIDISTTSNQWGCGYCRRKGGPEELRAFAAERRARA